MKVQVLSEMIISNESNILTSRVLSHFNRSRQLLFTIKLRYKDLEKVQHICLVLLRIESMCYMPHVWFYPVDGLQQDQWILGNAKSACLM